MEFKLTEEQALLRHMTERLVADRYSFEIHRAAIASQTGWNRAFWGQMAGLGLLGATLPVEDGGLGGSGIDMMVIMQALGKGLVLSPYVPTIVCAAALLAREGSEQQRAKYLPPVVAGDMLIAFACSEEDDRGEPSLTRTEAVRVDGGFCLTGGKTLVTFAAHCSHILVTARLAPNSTLGAFMVPRDTSGLDIRDFRTIDGGSASELRLDRLFVGDDDFVGGPNGIGDAIERVCDEGSVALCAGGCGSVEALLDTTVEYSKTRRQFGKQIGSFQVLQHRMVDMLVAREQTAAITHRAALHLGEAPQIRKREVSAAKAHVGRLGRFVSQAAVQIHGGIGITEEIDVSHHFRRIEMIDLQLGSVDDHIRRYASLLDTAEQLIPNG